MTTPHKISQWLSGTLPETFEMPALRDVVNKYPYFWPAGLLLLNTDEEETDYATASSLRTLYAPAPTRVMAELASISHDRLVAMDVEADAPAPPPAGRDDFSAEEETTTPTPVEADYTIAHGLEHDPLEDAVAATFIAEEGGPAHNTAAPSAMEEILEKADEPARAEADATNVVSSEPLPQPLYTSDYFSHQGVAVDAELPDARTIQKDSPQLPEEEDESDPDRGLMVMRSFSDWMTFFQRSAQEAQEEEESKRAVRAMWQKEKLAAALEEEEEEIPEEVFQMAVASIEPDTVASEPLAQILASQGKWERAIDMYRKLATKEPSKSAYFARKIEALEAQHPAQ